MKSVRLGRLTKKVIDQLKISYDGLDHEEKELFLDIACFFRGKMKDDAMEILDACGFYPAIAVKVLIEKALITVSKDGRFDMHDLVQEMGHYIVRGKHPKNPGKHSRVWQKKDIKDLCSRNATMENDKIEAIDIETIDIDHNHFSSFMMLVSNIKKLRFLSVTTHASRSGHHEGPSFLSNELRYIYWCGYPASPFPESFQLTKLVALKMEGSIQKELWKGHKYLPCLKELELSWMEELVRTPDIGGLPCLQKLIIHYCESLEEIHESLGNHSSLVSLSVSDCNKLRRFPSIVGMKKLKILKISECKALMSIEGNFQALKGLKNFELNARVPFGKFKFDILSHLPRYSLRKLNLSYCGLKDGEIPCEVGELSNLQELDLSFNHFTRLDFRLSRLTRLKLLDLSGCSHLVELPELPSSLAILKADWCESLEDVIRDEIHTNCKWLSQVSIYKLYCSINMYFGNEIC